jgi:hypothetical protein
MGNLVKTVELKILASAGDAQAQLDSITEKADRLDGNAIKMRFKLDAAEGKAQLDDISARAKELGFKDVSIRVRVDGAGRAIAELAAVKREEDKASSGGILSKLLGGLNSAGSALPLIGGLGPAAIPALAAGVATLLPEIVAVGSGFAAAGAGAGAFYLLAHPAINNLTGDIKALDAANQAVGFAQNVEQINPTKANALALKNAQVKYQAIYAQMGQDAGPAAAGMLKLHDEYVKLSTAFAPDVFKVFNAGLKVANQLLPAALPFARTFATSLTGLLGQLGKFTQSSGFASFLQQFRSLEGPAVTAIGQGIGSVANAFGKLLTVFSGKDVANGITIAFHVISGAISAVRGVVVGLKTAWDSLSQTSTFKKLASDFSQAWDSIVKTGGKKPDFSALTAAVKDAAMTAITFLSSKLGPLIDTALQTAGKWLSSNAGSVLVPAGQHIMTGLIEGMRSQMPSLLGFLGNVAKFIAEHKGPVSADRLLLVPHGQAMIAGLIAGMNSQMAALRGAAAKAAAAAVAGIKTELAYARSVAASAVSGLSLTSINLTTDTVTSGMQSYLATLKSFTADIRALSAQHLNTTLLKQLITAGPVTGDQYAQSILQGSTAQVNALYRQITQQSAVLGAQAANSVYGNNKIAATSAGTLQVDVTVRLAPDTGQAQALQIIKVLKEYKRNGGGGVLGIA